MPQDTRSFRLSAWAELEKLRVARECAAARERFHAGAMARLAALTYWQLTRPRSPQLRGIDESLRSDIDVFAAGLARGIDASLARELARMDRLGAVRPGLDGRINGAGMALAILASPVAVAYGGVVVLPALAWTWLNAGEVFEEARDKQLGRHRARIAAALERALTDMTPPAGRPGSVAWQLTAAIDRLAATVRSGARP